MSTTTRSSFRPLRPFHTPVRGHVFSARPPAGAPLDRADLRLRAEPDNPADRWAVAVWAEGGGEPWRVGYLERAVAARLAPRLRADDSLTVRFRGWWDAPDGGWRRPVVWVASIDAVPPPQRERVRALPPARVHRVVESAA